MVSTRLGKEIEKNVFLFNITSVGQRKKIVSSHEALNLRP